MPYIKSVPSTWDNETLKNFTVETTFSKEEFCNKLKLENCNQIEIDNINRSTSNRVNKLQINNNEYLGTEIRKLLNLRSTDFTIDIELDKVTIITRGYGHGGLPDGLSDAESL